MEPEEDKESPWARFMEDKHSRGHKVGKFKDEFKDKRKRKSWSWERSNDKVKSPSWKSKSRDEKSKSWDDRKSGSWQEWSKSKEDD